MKLLLNDEKTHVDPWSHHDIFLGLKALCAIARQNLVKTNHCDLCFHYNKTMTVMMSKVSQSILHILHTSLIATIVFFFHHLNYCFCKCYYYPCFSLFLVLSQECFMFCRKRNWVKHRARISNQGWKFIGQSFHLDQGGA